ncbi:MAG: 3-dehydroquinate synthase [Bacteroidales bacterium]|nr:3-dehydroquinate synthase [Bacteroidales bacterium]
MERITDFEGLEKYLQAKPNSTKVIISDENTTEHCLGGLIMGVDALLSAQIIEIPSGEQAKSLETYQSVIEALIEQGCDRNTTLIALGGGVVCDVVGFVAGTFKRGISSCYVPTTTLAMVDAAIGGKCGLDIGTVKNQIGLFYPAEVVCIEPELTDTLDERQIKNGAVEMLKTFLIADRELAIKMLGMPVSEAAKDPSLIRSCMAIKQEIVNQDMFDKGKRQLLNFGHTFGHAIESLAMQQGRDALHGEAVAQGIYHALSLSESLDKAERDLIADYLCNNYTIEPIKEDLPLLFNYMNADKKNTDNNYNFVLLDAIGKARHGCQFQADQLLAIFDKLD